MAKSVMDAGWGMLRAFLRFKGQQAGRDVIVVNESYTTQACSHCGSHTGPKGRSGLNVRIWMCGECGVIHDRNINAAINIKSAGRCPSSVCGNESSTSDARPSQAPTDARQGSAHLMSAT